MSDPRPHGRFSRWLRVVAVLAAVLSVASYGGISVLTADFLTRPSNHRHRLDPRVVSADAQAWSVRTADGLTLRGWYYPTREHKHLLVLVHGMKSDWEEMAALGHDLHAEGYDLLLFDLRGHGQSDPSRLFMGRRERLDLRAVLSWANGRGFPSDRIGWLGFSMGASTVLMEAAQNPEIRVAVLDSPFADLPALLSQQLPQHSHLPPVFNPGILTAAHWAFGVRTDDLKPVRSASRWGQRPLMLIHGEADSIVPIGQARLLAQRLGPSCRAVLLPGVEHVQAYEANPARYVAAVDHFFTQNLKP